ncbi:hypothetical protein ACFV0O_04845 [Kitasatospora sp. NPDC059577]|uniref:hypothetical protein n=1 Tax=Kitasatospora sp. NPDC059577 TaxID=3346873 RepID=UPI00368C9B8A
MHGEHPVPAEVLDQPSGEGGADGDAGAGDGAEQCEGPGVGRAVEAVERIAAPQAKTAPPPMPVRVRAASGAMTSVVTESVTELVTEPGSEATVYTAASACTAPPVAEAWSGR